jgi:hypothetical protein
MKIQTKPTPTALSYDALKEKQRAIRDGFPDVMGLRVHRALSWLGRAEQESDDPDVRFVLLWIGFNAAYAGHLSRDIESERGEFNSFFETLVELDGDGRIYDAVWSRFSHEIRLLLDNRFVYAPFWEHANGSESHGDWAERLERSKRSINAALAARDTPRILSTMFDRLYVLRNQIVHGGSTWNSSINRDQVRDGAAVLGCLLPLFVDIMMDNPDRDWGKPYYPVLS